MFDLKWLNDNHQSRWLVKAKIAHFFQKLRASYWFLPTVMGIFAVVLSSQLVSLDSYIERQRLIDLSWIKMTGVAGARAILSTVASSMITVTGIVFSITILSLSLASQQFGPRLLQNFMRDRGNQFVLGTVTSTYLYCLLVLRSISEAQNASSIPHLSVLVAVLLAVLCVAVLVYFIHHVAEAIQITNVIAGVSHSLHTGIDRLFPDRISDGLGAREIDYALADLLPPDFDRQVRPVSALTSGYLQSVDLEGLLQLAEKQDLVMRIGHRVGHFIIAGSPLVELWPGDALEREGLIEEINDCFITGHKRSTEQDVVFLINELLEIAARALSPGVNDPLTAISCIDHLGVALCDLAQRVFPPRLQTGKENRLRIIAYPITFERLVGTAFNPIRQYGRTHVAVTIRLLEIIKVILPFTCYPEQREALLEQAGLIERGSQDAIPEAADRKDIHDRYLAIFQTLEQSFGLAGDS